MPVGDAYVKTPDPRRLTIAGDENGLRVANPLRIEIGLVAGETLLPPCIRQLSGTGTRGPGVLELFYGVIVKPMSISVIAVVNPGIIDHE